MELLFHIENRDNWNLHIGLCGMPGWPCLWLRVADDRIIMIVGTDCQVCATRNKSSSGSALDKRLVPWARRFVLMYSTYEGLEDDFSHKCKEGRLSVMHQDVNCMCLCDCECSLPLSLFLPLFYPFLHFPNCVYWILFLQREIQIQYI